MNIQIKRARYFRAKFHDTPSIIILPCRFHPRLRWRDLAEMSNVWESLAYVPAPTARQDRIAL